MRSAFRFVAVAAFVLFVGTFCAADPITGGLSTLTGTINFDQVGDLQEHVFVTNQYAGVTISGFEWDSGTLGQYQATGFTAGGDLVNGFPGTLYQPMSITFDTAVSAAAFAAVNQQGEFLIQAYLGDTFVESFAVTVPNMPGTGFIGFGNSQFDRIYISRINSGDTSAISIDTLQYLTYTPDPGGGSGGDPGSTSVPEPASLVLFGSGISSLGLMLRRKRGK